MLILSRKTGETVVIDGRIRVKVIRVEGDVVKIGIEPPPEVSIHREEVYNEIQRSNQEAADRLGKSRKTVAGQLTSIYKKLGLSNRARLIAALR